MSAKVMDYEGIKTLLHRAQERFPRLSHLWLDAGYRREDKGKDWVEKTLGWSVEFVQRPRKPAPEEVLMGWAHDEAARPCLRPFHTVSGRNSGSVKLHSWVTTLGQQGTEVQDRSTSTLRCMSLCTQFPGTYTFYPSLTEGLRLFNTELQGRV
jgi:hypothetical protein